MLFLYISFTSFFGSTEEPNKIIMKIEKKQM